jgi:hypothetical protein
MIKFAEANALFIRAQSSHWIEVANLRQLATELQKTKRWDWRWKLITGMRIASPLAVIMSASAGAAVSIEGTAKALEEFGLGSLGSETDLSITGDAALKMIGAKGPFLLELVRILPFLGPARAAGSTGNLELDPYVVVSPELFVEDDDE